MEQNNNNNQVSKGQITALIAILAVIAIVLLLQFLAPTPAPTPTSTPAPTPAPSALNFEQEAKDAIKAEADRHNNALRNEPEKFTKGTRRITIYNIIPVSVESMLSKEYAVNRYHMQDQEKKEAFEKDLNKAFVKWQLYRVVTGFNDYIALVAQDKKGSILLDPISY